jgi:outer membrane lipoprotein-sorting protein
VTLAVWARTNKASPIQTVISHDDGYYDRALVIDRRGGGTGWSAFGGDGGVLGYHPSQVGQWTFIAVVYDQDNGTVRLFVDGSMYDGNGICNEGWDYIHIGENPAFAEFFSGEIDEVKIYDYALSSDELKSLHETGLAGSGAAPTPGDGGAPAGDGGGVAGDGGTGGETLEEILARGADIPPVKYDQVLTVPGQPTVKFTVWAEGSRFRVEVPTGELTMIQLIDLDNKIMYMYNPEENMAMEMDLSGFEGLATEMGADILDYHPTVIGTETLDGMVCQVVAYTYTDLQGGEAKAKQWLWKERGFPIRVETTSQGQTSIMEMKNIEFGDIPDEMFELPDGVEIMEFSGGLPEMPD